MQSFFLHEKWSCFIDKQIPLKDYRVVIVLRGESFAKMFAERGLSTNALVKSFVLFQKHVRNLIRCAKIFIFFFFIIFNIGIYKPVCTKFNRGYEYGSHFKWIVLNPAFLGKVFLTLQWIVFQSLSIFFFFHSVIIREYKFHRSGIVF